MNRFEWVNATSVDQALASVIAGSSFKAGGIDLLDLMKDGIAAPPRLVNIRNIDGLNQIAQGLIIGPLVTLTQIEEHPVIQKKYSALAEAASRAATPQIRNMATIGGNLAQRPRCWYFRSEDFHCRKKGGHHCFAQDGENEYHAIFDNRTCAIVHPSGLAVPLVAMNARLELTSKKGKRELPLEQFFITPDQDVTRENVLQPDDLITNIIVPATSARTAYYKQGEKESFDWPIADVAAVIDRDGAKCKSASIVLGAASPTPHRAVEAEKALTGQTIDEKTVRDAAKAALAGASPLSQNGYKLPVFSAIIARTILGAAALA